MKMNNKLNAYTLSELLVVLIIIGILVLIALPNLMPLISKTKATEAKLQLEHVYTLQKSYFYMNSKYTTDLNEIDFVQEPLVGQSENGNANYKIEVTSAGSNAYIAKATAVVDFDGDGTFNVWQIDQDKNLKEIVID
jgi:type IV pilus assembly protein PilE